MRELRTSIIIHASPRVVWNVLTDFSRYPEWNPFIRRAAGTLQEGHRLDVHLEPPGGPAMKIRPRVLDVQPERTFRWLGRVGVRGLFDGMHIFELEPVGEGRVRFVHREEFRGVLVPFLWRMLDTRTRSGFEAMNAALQQQAEETVRP